MFKNRFKFDADKALQSIEEGLRAITVFSFVLTIVMFLVTLTLMPKPEWHFSKLAGAHTAKEMLSETEELIVWLDSYGLHEYTDSYTLHVYNSLFFVRDEVSEILREPTLSHSRLSDLRITIAHHENLLVGLPSWYLNTWAGWITIFLGVLSVLAFVLYQLVADLVEKRRLRKYHQDRTATWA